MMKKRYFINICRQQFQTTTNDKIYKKYMCAINNNRDRRRSSIDDNNIQQQIKQKIAYGGNYKKRTGHCLCG